MAPIQISRLHRLTNEVTPTGTIISINMVIGISFGTLLHELIQFLKLSDLWQRIIALCMLAVALIVIGKQARDEWRQST